MFETANQFWVFLACVFLGGCIFFIYKLTHIIPLKKKWQLAIADVIFCIFTFFAVWLGLLFICCGSLRWFCFVGIAAGFYIASKTLNFCIDICIFRLYNLVITKINKRKSNDATDEKH